MDLANALLEIDRVDAKARRPPLRGRPLFPIRHSPFAVPVKRARAGSGWGAEVPPELIFD